MRRIRSSSWKLLRPASAFSHASTPCFNGFLHTTSSFVNLFFLPGFPDKPPPTPIALENSGEVVRATLVGAGGLVFSLRYLLRQKDDEYHGEHA